MTIETMYDYMGQVDDFEFSFETATEEEKLSELHEFFRQESLKYASLMTFLRQELDYAPTEFCKILQALDILQEETE